MTDIRTLLHDAAPKPSEPLDVQRLLHAAPRRSVRRRLAWWAAAGLSLIGLGLPLRSALVPADRDSESGTARCIQVDGEPADVPAGNRPLRVTELGRIDLGHRWPAVGMAMWGHRVAYATDQGAAVICDLRTGRARVVASPSQPGWEVVTLAGHGDTLVFTEADGFGPDGVQGEAATTWRMAALDLHTGRRQEIRQAELIFNSGLPPRPVVEESVVAWTEPVREREGTTARTALYLHDLRSGRTAERRDFAIGSMPDLQDGSLWGIRDSHVVRASADPVPEDPGKVVDHTAGALWTSVSRRTLAWTVADSSGSAALRVLPLDHDPRARPVAVGPVEEVVAGDGFVFWSRPNSGLHVHAGDKHHGYQVTSDESVAPGLLAAGDRIAWVTGRATDEGLRLTLHLARVVR